MRSATAALLAAFPLFLCGALIAAPMSGTPMSGTPMSGSPMSGSPHGRIVGYVTRWDAAEDKDLGKIDTLIFAFAQVVDGRVTLEGAAMDRLHTCIALRAAHPALKVAISVGGWGAGGFSEAAGSASGRQAFADSAAQLLAAQDADGLDVDWEYPGHGEAGIRASPEDRANFTLLLQALRAALDRAGAIHERGGAIHERAGARHFTLSIAAADGPFAGGIDIAAVSPYLDWFNLMTYDFVNRLTPFTGHHSGLGAANMAPPEARNARRAVQQFLDAGVPSGKLVIGAAFYGREFADVVPDHHGLYQRYGRYQGELPWPQLRRDYIGKNGFVRYWDSAAQAAWLWNARTRRFVSYDDPQSIAAKAAFVKEFHLGGIMYWEQSLDPGGELLNAAWRGLQ